MQKKYKKIFDQILCELALRPIKNLVQLSFIKKKIPCIDVKNMALLEDQILKIDTIIEIEDYQFLKINNKTFILFN